MISSPADESTVHVELWQCSLILRILEAKHSGTKNNKSNSIWINNSSKQQHQQQRKERREKREERSLRTQWFGPKSKNRSSSRISSSKQQQHQQQRKESREITEERKNCKLDSLHLYRVAHGRDGRHKGQARRDLSLESLYVEILKLPNLAPMSHDSVPGSYKTCWAAAGGLFCFDIRRRFHDGGCKQSQWSETSRKQTPQQQQGPAQAAEGRIRNKKAASQRVTSSGSSKQLSNGNGSTAT